MRISDWSSDVCSSDLRVVEVRVRPGRPGSFIPGFILPRHRQRAAERLGEPDELFAEYAIDCGRDLGDVESHITSADVDEADRNAGIVGFYLQRPLGWSRLATLRALAARQPHICAWRHMKADVCLVEVLPEGGR